MERKGEAGMKRNSKQLPHLLKPLYMAEVARLAGMPVWWVRRTLIKKQAASKRMGVLGRKGGRYVTTLERVIATFPELGRMLVAKLRGEDSDWDSDE